MTCSQTRPAHISPKSGPSGVLPRVGFKPTNPQQDAGMRIEPPPSLACPIGAIPAATAAADPPLDPPPTRRSRQGLRVAPLTNDSVLAQRPSSGVAVLAMVTKPARRKR